MLSLLTKDIPEYVYSFDSNGIIVCICLVFHIGLIYIQYRHSECVHFNTSRYVLSIFMNSKSPAAEELYCFRLLLFEESPFPIGAANNWGTENSCDG